MKCSTLAIAVFFSAAFPFFTNAAPVSKNTIDMTIPLREEGGVVSKRLDLATPSDPKCEKCPPVTIGFAIAHALNLTFDDERNLPGEQKWARSALAERIKDEKAAVLTAPETALIEKLVNKAYGGAYIMQIIPVIDPNHPVPAVAE